MKLTWLLVLGVAAIVESSVSEQPSEVKCPAWNLPGTIIRLPHPTNCESYYNCVFGHPHLKSCPLIRNVRLYFNPKLKTCDYPLDAGCDDPTPTLPPPPPPPPTPTPTSTPPPPCDPYTSDCPPDGMCRVRHETNCRAYYACQNGKKQFECCTEGHYFNPNVQACDIDQRGICLATKCP